MANPEPYCARWRLSWQWSVLALVCVAAVVSFATLSFATPLDAYVAQSDDAYAWHIVDEQTSSEGMRIIGVELTSQRWQGIEWQHRLMIVIPETTASPEAGLLFISGSGSGRDEVDAMIQMASLLHVPTAVLLDTPNQPLFDGLREDALIAHSFLRFMETDDASWPLLLPMVKGAVRALDAFQEVVYEELTWNLDRFVVTGASKRGWTTWLTAAVDERVVGIAPIVYNNLDLPQQMDLQRRTFAAGASAKIHDYTDRGILNLLGSEEGQELSAIVDPYTYRDRLSLPKLLLHGTNDPYWPVDALNVYLNDLPGETFLVNIANAGHDLDDLPRVLRTLATFFNHAAQQPLLPELDWRVSEAADGAFTLHVPRSATAQAASLWVAISPTRDFTKATWGEIVPNIEGDTWLARPTGLRDMYIALYIDVDYWVADEQTVRLSTPIFVLEPK